MNKSKWKIVFLVILAVVLCLGAYKIADATSYHFVKAKAEHYLCKKYDAKRSDFELINYKKAHIYWDDYYIFWLTPKWCDFSFEYKYNDRRFFVNRYNSEFYDDYQLDDIENWCVEWLQQNVDERINAIEMSSYTIVDYYKNSKKSNSKKINKSEALAFLNEYSKSKSYDEACIEIYFKSDFLNYDELRKYRHTIEYQEEKKELLKKYNSFIDNENNIYFIISDRTVYKQRSVADKDYNWSYYITL